MSKCSFDLAQDFDPTQSFIFFQDHRVVHKDFGQDYSARRDEIYGSFCRGISFLLWGVVFVCAVFQAKSTIQVRVNCMLSFPLKMKRVGDFFLAFYSGFEDVLLSGFRALSEQQPIAEDYSTFK